MNYKKISNKVQVRYLINIFLLVGFVIASTKLENHFNNSKDYSYIPVLVNNELVINEPANEKNISKHYYSKSENLFYNVEEIVNTHSYSLIIIGYNSFIRNKFKTIILKYISLRDIISILQKNNIWHKSSEEVPGILI